MIAATDLDATRSHEIAGCVLARVCAAVAAGKLAAAAAIATGAAQRWAGAASAGDGTGGALVWLCAGSLIVTGVLALAVARARSGRGLAAGVVAQVAVTALAFGWYVTAGGPPATAVWAGIEAAVTAVFWLCLIARLRPDLAALNAGAILPGLARERTGKALLVYYSLSGNGGRAIERVRAGLEAGGYRCYDCAIRPRDRQRFGFPFRSVAQFADLAIGALLRRPAAVEWQLDGWDEHSEGELRAGIAADHDLVVCASQTWMLGISAPIQGFFEHHAVSRLIAGRDVAIVNVCRGLWRRSQSQLAHGCSAAGGHLVAASAHCNPGREPMRLVSLFLFLALGPDRWPAHREGFWLTRQFLDPRALAALECFGRRLAGRPGPGQATAWPDDPDDDPDDTAAGRDDGAGEERRP